jgi:hypothetical protein
MPVMLALPWKFLAPAWPLVGRSARADGVLCPRALAS